MPSYDHEETRYGMDEWRKLRSPTMYLVPESTLEPVLTQSFLLHEIINFFIA